MSFFFMRPVYDQAFIHYRGTNKDSATLKNCTWNGKCVMQWMQGVTG